MSSLTPVRCLALCVLLALPGCMTVKTARASFPSPPGQGVQSMPGIPFYIKTAACKHQAVWAEMRYEIKFSQVTEGDPASDRSGQKTLDQSEARDITLLGSISGKKITDPSDRKKYRAALNRIVAARDAMAPMVRDADALNHDPNVELVSDTASIQTYVDYSVLYYYNTARPLIGTSKADVHLAADGTLTEGESELNDSTGSTIATFLTSLPGMALGYGTKGNVPYVSQASIPGSSDTFTVTVTVKTYKHSIEQWKKDVRDPSVCTTEWNGTAYSSNTVTLATDASESKKDSGSKNIVQFNGQIQLPAAGKTEDSNPGDPKSPPR